MLDICRRRAQERGLSPTLYHQAMENLESRRRYGCIIVPCGSIQLVVEQAAAQEALVRFRRHLRPGGVLILTIFNRWHEIRTERLGEWAQRFDRLLPDGARLVKHSKVESSDDTDQLLECTVRYRRVRDGAVVEEQVCATPERWFTRNEMCLMLEIAGFSEVSVTGDFSDEPAADTHETFVFNAQ